MIIGQRDKKFVNELIKLSQEQSKIIKKQADEILLLTKMLKKAVSE